MRRRLFAALCAAMLAACAADLPRSPTSFTRFERAEGLPEQFVLTTGITVSPPSMFKREIKGGTQWRLVGRIPQGAVYRPVDSVFTLESAHVHEAYLVLDGRALAGAYLPVEQSFVKLDPIKDLPIR